MIGERDESGILLLETLIAFVIAALALVVVYRAIFDGAAASSIASRSEAALSRAQSRLAAFEAFAPSARYVKTGDDGDGFRYREAAQPLPPVGASPLRLMRLSVTESWGGPGPDTILSRATGQGRHVTLTTEIAVQAPSPSP